MSSLWRAFLKLKVPVLFFLSLPFFLLYRAAGYFLGGGRAKAASLREEYPKLLEAAARRMGGRVERVRLEGARVHSPAGAAKDSSGTIELEAVVLGPEGGDAPLAVMLHGFPDSLTCFEPQARALVAEGYRVVLPHLRGYGRSDRPAGWRNYRMELLALDVALLIDRYGGRALVAGHDWGGQVAWTVAHLHASRVTRLVIANSPHPYTFKKMVLGSLEQLVSSWYMFFFQVPWVPEWCALLDAESYARLVFGRTGHSDDDRRLVASAWLQDGAYTGMINYYRALPGARGPLRPPRFLALDASMPVLMVWGVRDRFITEAGAELPPRYVTNGRVVRLPEAGHFCTHHRPRQVTDAVLEFVREQDE